MVPVRRAMLLSVSPGITRYVRAWTGRGRAGLDWAVRGCAGLGVANVVAARTAGRAVGGVRRSVCPSRVGVPLTSTVAFMFRPSGARTVKATAAFRRPGAGVPSVTLPTFRRGLSGRGSLYSCRAA